jgi:hypothetical protein
MTLLSRPETTPTKCPRPRRVRERIGPPAASLTLPPGLRTFDALNNKILGFAEPDAAADKSGDLPSAHDRTLAATTPAQRTPGLSAYCPEPEEIRWSGHGVATMTSHRIVLASHRTPA